MQPPRQREDCNADAHGRYFVRVRADEEARGAAVRALHPLCADDVGASWLPFIEEVQANVHAVTAELRGETALHAAAEHLRPAYCALLVARGADVNAAETFDGATPLHAVVQDRSVLLGPDGVTAGGSLLPAGADARAVEALEGECARVLLRGGARLGARDRLGETPLAHAARYGRAALLRVLLKAASTVAEADVPGWARPGTDAVVVANADESLLAVAVAHQNFEAVVALCETDVRLVEDRVHTSLREIAVRQDLLEIDEVLRAHGL